MSELLCSIDWMAVWFLVTEAEETSLALQNAEYKSRLIAGICCTLYGQNGSMELENEKAWCLDSSGFVPLRVDREEG